MNNFNGCLYKHIYVLCAVNKRLPFTHPKHMFIGTQIYSKHFWGYIVFSLSAFNLNYL